MMAVHVRTEGGIDLASNESVMTETTASIYKIVTDHFVGPPTGSGQRPVRLHNTPCHEV
jgi:hypothetical protein